MALPLDIRIRMHISRCQRKKACYEILFMPLLGLHVTSAQRSIVGCWLHEKLVTYIMTGIRLD